MKFDTFNLNGFFDMNCNIYYHTKEIERQKNYLLQYDILDFNLSCHMSIGAQKFKTTKVFRPL